MPLEIGKLQDVLECCRAGKVLPADLAEWLGNALNNYLKQRSATLEEALGLRSRRGGVPWRRGIAIRERDEALRGLARTFFAEVPIFRQAVRIQSLSSRYAAANWHLDRTSETMPARYARTPHMFIWRAFMSGAPMPLGTRRLQSILRNRDAGAATPHDAASQQGGSQPRIIPAPRTQNGLASAGP